MHATATEDYDREVACERLAELLREQGKTDKALNLEMHTEGVQELWKAMRSETFLADEETDALLANRDFFHPYLRNAPPNRARIAGVPEKPADGTDCQAVFLLTEMQDAGIIPDLIKCLRMDHKNLDLLYGDTLTEHMWIPFARSGHEQLDTIWDSVTDEPADEYARGLLWREWLPCIISIRTGGRRRLHLSSAC
jgi:hypothetical protein